MKDVVKVKGYDAFKCIGGECPFTCCQEWRIGVDEETLQKWQVAGIKVDEYTKADGEDKVIALNKNHICPFLQEDKLCQLVCNHGEDHISETCQSFPRQITYYDTHEEYGLDTGCPVVVDWLSQMGDSQAFEVEGYLRERDVFYILRNKVMTLVADTAYTAPQALLINFYLVLELLEHSRINKSLVEDCWRQIGRAHV